MVQSEAVVRDLFAEMIAFNEGSRYLAAFETLTRLRAAQTDEAVDPTVKAFLADHFKEHAEIVQKLSDRHAEVLETLHYQDADQKWTVGAQFFGITTSYQYDHVDHSLILKLEGVMEDLPLFEQCAVINEVELFPTWLPFCREGVTVDRLGKAELIPYVQMFIPPMLGRDFIMQAYGADCLHEHGKLLIVGKSIEEYSAKKAPFKAKGWFQDRMTVKMFKSITEVLSPTSAKTIIVAEVDPKCPLPHAILNLVIQKLAGVVLYYFQKQVMKVCKDLDSEHVHRIRANTEFYQHWVLPKLREFCDLKGWEQPTILSLGDAGKPPAKLPSTEAHATDKHSATVPPAPASST